MGVNVSKASCKSPWVKAQKTNESSSGETIYEKDLDQLDTIELQAPRKRHVKQESKFEQKIQQEVRDFYKSTVGRK